MLIGSKPLSMLKERPPELKHSLLARSKGASVLRDCAPTLAVAAPAVVVVSSWRRSGTDGEITLIRKITLMILCVKHCVS